MLPELIGECIIHSLQGNARPNPTLLEAVATLLGIASDTLNVFLYLSRTQFAKEGDHVGTGRIHSGSHRGNHVC
jgi:hypothetical protein